MWVLGGYKRNIWCHFMRINGENKGKRPDLAKEIKKIEQTYLVWLQRGTLASWEGESLARVFLVFWRGNDVKLKGV